MIPLDVIAPVAPDSTTIVGQLTGVLSQGVPWLDPKISAQIGAYLAHLLLGLPVSILIIIWEVVGNKLQALIPWLGKYVGQHLSNFSWIINPILGGVIGGAFGDSTIGLAAGMVWNYLKQIKFGEATLQGLTKGKQIALILGLGLLLTSNTASAQGSKLLAKQWQETLAPYGLTVTTDVGGGAAHVPWTDFKRRGSIALGVIQSWESDDFTSPTSYVPVPKLGLEPGYTVLDWFKVRGGYYKSLVDKRADFQVGFWIFY